MTTSRLTALKESDLDAEQQKVLNEIRSHGGRLGGPYEAYIRDPDFMRINQMMGDRIRGSVLPTAVRHIAVLTTIRFWGAEFAWKNNSEAAARDGIAPQIISAIDRLEEDPSMSPSQRAAQRMALSLLRCRSVPDDLYESTSQVMNESELVSLVYTVGFFSMVSMTLLSFRIEPG